MNDASKLPIEPEQLPTELCPFGLYGAERRALDVVAEARRVHQSTLEDDNELWNCLRDEAKSIFDAAIVSIASHPDYRPTDPEMWHRVLDGMRSAMMPAVAVNAHVQPVTGPEWEMNGRASEVPATKLDLSKPLFPPEPNGLDRFDETVASERGPARVDFADVKAATLRSLDYIIPRLLPGGKRVGNEWVVRNPTRDDKKARSFSINMKTGVWCDFATGEIGADMIDLYAYLNGGSNVQAKDALAEMLNVQARSGSTSKAPSTPPKRSFAAPGDFREPPKAFPARTPPDKDGKPGFVVAGDEGPPVRSNELRRHVFHRGGVPVRIKIIKKDKKGALNVYRVTGADGVTGWQYAKPESFQQIPYFIAGSDPFTRFINQPIFWTEGEKDVETVGGLGGLAFTFGGTGDGLPDACQQYVVGRHVVILADNDEPGRKHADEKAALAAKVSASVKVIHFPELADKGDVSDWIEAGKTFDDLKALVDATENWKPAQDTSDPNEIEIFWHGNSYNRVARPALIKDLIPEAGVGLASGQWGAGKTFAVIDLATSVMTVTPFAGREVCRRGGVLFIAAEGASEIPVRLEGVVNHKLRPSLPIPGLTDVDNLPFAWIEECPSLKEDASFERLVKIVLAAANEMKERLNVDLVLIIIDTLSASADFTDANDAAEGQRIMNRLNTLSRRTGAFTLAVDHFGKSVETGTRGSSAKEAAADVVLAILADRDVSGNVTNTRMAVRKLRGGSTGTETPFELKVVDLGFDQTTCIIEWRPERTPTSAGWERVKSRKDAPGFNEQRHGGIRKDDPAIWSRKCWRKSSRPPTRSRRICRSMASRRRHSGQGAGREAGRLQPGTRKRSSARCLLSRGRRN